MKKIFSILGIALGATLILSSCGDNIGGSVTPAGEHQIMIRASEGVDTRTHIDGTAVKWDASDEYLKVYEVATPTEGDAVTSKGNSAEGATSDGGNTMSFGVTLSAKDAATYDFDYYAFYPSSAYHSATDVVTNVAINTSDTQTPTATSFDPAADLLIAEGITGEASQPENLAMRFTRMVAVGRMTVKNLESTDPVTRITFSAKVGGTPVVLAGRTAYDLTNASVKTTYGSNVAATAIILDYSALDLTANTSAGMTAFFTCYPFALNSSTPGSFKVIVETATQTFTKEVSVSTAKGLVFNVGKASTFSVDMDGIAGEDKAADLRYAFLSFDDYDNTPGTSNSYSNVTVTKTHGDAWETSALKNSGGIQINTGHYIKLPDFVENIKTVTVTLSAVSAGVTLALETTSTGEDEDIASTTTTSDLIYEFDLSSDTKKTAYLLSSGTIKFAKIEVYAGEDNRSALSTPTGLTASINETDPAVTNTIDVSWTAVDNAGSYIVTMHPTTTGDDVIFVANTNSCSAVGLEYEKSYTATVVAVPADPYVYKNSNASAASSAVATGAESGPQYELVSTAVEVTEGDYVITWENSYYLPSDTEGSNPAVGSGITVANNKISCAVTADMVWTFTGDNTNGFTISAGSNYLNSQNKAQGISVSSTIDTTTWKVSVDGTYGMLLKGSDAGTRYLAVYNSTDWRYYATGASYTGKMRLYKLVDSRDAAPISWSSASGSATWSSSGITSTLPSLTNESSLEVTYTSSDESVATIDGSGVVTIVAGGSTTISATYTGTAVSTYKTTTVSYALTVTDSRTACETPTFTPAAGEVAADTEVTITSGTTGSTIYYTTDGSTPTIESSHGSAGAASATVTIDSSPKTIKAIAVKDNYLVSTLASATYTVAGASTTIADVISGGANTYEVPDVVVYAIKGNMLIIGDESAKMFAYKSSHGLSIGDKRTVSGSTTTTSAGVYEFDGPDFTGSGTAVVNHGAAAEFNDVATTLQTSFSDASNRHTAVYVHATGTQSGRNITTAGGKVLYLAGTETATDGKAVEVYGYVYAYSTTYSNFNFMVTSISLDPSVPTLTTTPTNGNTLLWADNEYGAGNAKTITVTLNGNATGYTVSSGTSAWTVSDNGTGTITVYPNAANESDSEDKTLNITVTHNDNGGLTSTITLKQNRQAGGGGVDVTGPWATWGSSSAFTVTSNTVASKVSSDYCGTNATLSAYNSSDTQQTVTAGNSGSFYLAYFNAAAGSYWQIDLPVENDIPVGTTINLSYYHSVNSKGITSWTVNCNGNSLGAVTINTNGSPASTSDMTHVEKSYTTTSTITAGSTITFTIVAGSGTAKNNRITQIEVTAE